MIPVKGKDHMGNKHIAASGAKQGRWVDCSAQQCTLTSANYHTTAAELVQVQQYVENKTGEKVTGERLSLQSVLEYKILSENSKKEIADKVEERKEAARAKKAGSKKQPGTVLRDRRAAAYEQYKTDNDQAKYLKNYLADYPNLARLPERDLVKLFKAVEKPYGSDQIMGDDRGGSKLGLTSQERRYRELNNNPNLIPAVLNPETALRRASQRTASSTNAGRQEAASTARKVSAQLPETVKLRHIKAGVTTRTAIKDSLELLRGQGCEVTYTESRTMLSTTFYNIEIKGPSRNVQAWKSWIRNIG